MTSVKIFSGSACSACVDAKTWFKNKGIKFEEFDVFKDKKAFDFVVEQGGMLPVIVINNKIFKGFCIKELEEELL